MLKELLRKNRSYRGYDRSVPVTREQMLDMVDCARYAPFSQNYQSFKYVLVHTRAGCDALQPCTGWARGLPDMTLPHPGHCPTGFIVMCYDSTIGPGVDRFWKDVGICAQTILLRATEMGLGGCMIGNFNPEKVRETLELEERFRPVLIIALGKPDETVVLTELKPGESYNYYRDENDVHYVPKRPLEELIIK